MLSLALAVLVIIAHPDDEILFADFLHALTHKLNATVDLVCIPNGEGGFRYSAPSESLYGNLQLSKENIGREHLPCIRKQELFASGRWIIQLFEQTIKTGNGANGYDLMLIMLSNVQSHGHHRASRLLALETIKRLQQNKLNNIKIPIVISGSEFVLTEPPLYTLNQLAEISLIPAYEFQFNRTWKLSNSSNIPDYQMIVLWMCSAHKSQGGLIAETLTTLARKNEQYFYFSINDELNDQARIQLIQNLFKQLTEVHRYESGNML